MYKHIQNTCILIKLKCISIALIAKSKCVQYVSEISFKCKKNIKVESLFLFLSVAITACVSSTQSFSDYVVRFSNVKYHVGINNLDIFKSRGKFVCEIAGLYYISAYIYTASSSYAFYLKKNSVNVASSASNSGSSTTSIPISAVVELQLKDTLYMDAVLTIQGSHSCLSIIKVK